jgi:hypothetical protein
VSTTSAAILVSGTTGSGKTSLLATLFEWVYKVHKKKSRLYTADGGGYGDKMEALIALGVVEVFRLRTRVASGGEGLVEETCTRASYGWAPVVIDWKTGEAEPRGRMVPPVQQVFSMFCSEGHLLLQAESQKGLQPTRCPQCNKVVTLQSARVESQSAPATHMKGIGAVGFEGISSWSNWQLMSLAERRGRRELHGMQSNLGGFQSGDLFFDSNNMPDYQFAQSQCEKWILNSTSIPGLVVPPVWTGLETKVEETGDRAALWGPQIAGSARTGQVPQWVGDYLGAQVIPVADGKHEFRLYLSRYTGPDGVPHAYKTRVTPGFLPEYLKDGDGVPFSGFNLGKYMELREEAKRRSMEAATREIGVLEGERIVVAEEKVAQGQAVALVGGGAVPLQPPSSSPTTPPIQRRLPPPPPPRRR